MIRLPRHANPLASILIVAYSRRDRLARCLQSLAASLADSPPTETVIVLNGATPDVRDFVTREVDGATLASSEVNAGFSGACNLGRSRARAPFLVLLNDDTAVEPGWLEPLIDTATTRPDAAIVGSVLLFPDGRLQEAGSIIWADGSTTPVGRGSEGVLPEYDFVREVDYCSACSLLVKTRVWDAVGGMDEGYFPAYYEDTDLCMKVRRRGERILLNPRSRVRHDEGSSSDDHFRHFLVRRHQRRFQARWRHELDRRQAAAPHSPAAVSRAIHSARRHPRRLLIIDDRLPDPGLGSGFARMLEVIRAVGDDYSVAFWCSAEAGAPTDASRDLGLRIVVGPLEAHLATPDVLYDLILVSRPHNYPRVEPAIRRWQPQAAVVYDAEALYHRRDERHLALIPDEASRAAVATELEATKRIETSVRSRVQGVVAVTAAEAAFFAGTPGDCHVVTITPEVPWARWTTKRFEERTGVLFVAAWLAGPGSPNADGLRWFVEEVWPKVVDAVPDATLTVTGEAPPEIQNLARGAAAFPGFAADLYDAYDHARVAIVPLRFGSGLCMKSLETLHYGVPVVTTRVGGADLDAIAPGAMCMADSPADFAESVATLLRDADRWARHRAAIVAARARLGSSRAQWRRIFDAAQLARREEIPA